MSPAGLGSSHRRALGIVADALEDRVFGIGGGALLALLGIEVVVGDLDIVFPAGTPPPDVPWEVREPELPPGPLSSDFVLRASVAGIDVDLVGGLRVAPPEGPPLPIPAVGGGTVEVDGRVVHLSPPEAWHVLYRSHNPDRAALLAAYLRSHG